MNHYYDSVAPEKLSRRIVDGDTVIIIGENGSNHIVVEEHDLNEWARLATSNDAGERLCATMLEFCTPKPQRTTQSLMLSRSTAPQ